MALLGLLVLLVLLVFGLAGATGTTVILGVITVPDLADPRPVAPAGGTSRDLACRQCGQPWDRLSLPRCVPSSSGRELRGKKKPEGEKET